MDFVSGLRVNHRAIDSRWKHAKMPHIMDTTPFISIVIPVYNEAARLPDTLRLVLNYLNCQPYSGEVLVVDDGSTDNTVAVIEEIVSQHQNLTIIRNAHRGKGFSVRTGMLAAAGKYILFSDADLAVPIEEFEKFLSCLEAGYDIVIGSREGTGARRVGEPFYRHVMGRAFNLLVRVVALDEFQDTQCGFKVFKRDVARRLFSMALLYSEDAKQLRGSAVTGFDVEILLLALKQGYKVKEVPIHWNYGNETKVRPFDDAWRNLTDVVKVRLYDLRGRYNGHPHNVG